MEQSVLDALNIFFKLKSRYEKEGEKLKQKILNREDLTLEEKRDMFHTQKRKCVKCKKPVGTIFRVEPNRYVALCGARESAEIGPNAAPNAGPCNLDIQITRGNIELLPDHVKELRKLHNKLVEQIMKIKYNLLFKFATEEETVSQFEKTRDAFDVNTSLYDASKTKLIEITNLLDKQEQINLTDLQLFEFVKEIKAMVEDAEHSGNSQMLKDVVELYIHKMLDVLKKNSDLKYAYQAVEQEGDQFHLVQKPYTVEQLETVVGGTNFKVIALRV